MKNTFKVISGNRRVAERRAGDRRKVNAPETLALMYFRKGLDLLSLSPEMLGRWEAEVLLARQIIDAIDRETTARINRRSEERRTRKAAA